MFLQPPGILLPKAHQIEREYTMLKTLHKHHYPVPKPLLLCDNENIIGTPFYVMEFVEGRIFRDPELHGMPAGERPKYYNALVNVLK
jgi:aminoglycoside phosphotransferase (APT) family kinase protein